MKKTIGTLTLAFAALSSGLACAENYWGLGVSSFEMEDNFDGVRVTADVRGIEGVFGFSSNPNIAWEARLGVGMGDDNVSLSYMGMSNSSLGLTFKVNTYLSGYFRPQIVKENFQLYGLLGYSSVSNEASFAGSTEDSTDSGVSYGLGAGIIFGVNNAINLEWKNLVKIDDGEIAGITLGYQRKF